MSVQTKIFPMMLVLVLLFSSCQILDLFKKKKSQSNSSGPYLGAVLGQNINERAGGPDDVALAALYGITSSHAPAAIRPDPDTFIRQMLRQYHPEGLTIAQQIGRIEPYRELLGGASEDFKVAPQSTYDATSLLATIKVAEEICTALVAPRADRHRDWQSILPYPASEAEANVEFLAQRFMGLPVAKINTEVLHTLLDILETNNQDSSYTYDSYIPVCMALAVDAEALLL